MRSEALDQRVDRAIIHTAVGMERRRRDRKKAAGGRIEKHWRCTGSDAVDQAVIHEGMTELAG
jgi:hypothetical protein